MRSVLAVLIVLSSLAAPVLAADPGGTEQTALGLVRAFTSGDADAAVAYMKEHVATGLWERRGDKGWTMIGTMLSNDLAGGEILGVDVPG